MSNTAETYRPIENEYRHTYDREIFRKQKKDRQEFITPEKTTVIFTQGNKGCIPLNDFVYSENGIVQVKEIKNGTRLLNGFVQSLYYYDDDIYEIDIDHVKHRFSGEHPIWVSKVPAQRINNYWGSWITVKDIFDSYNTRKPKNKWYVQNYRADYFKFNEISIGKSFARLLGYLMSDGTFSEKQSVKFTNVNPKILTDVAKLAMEFSEKMEFKIKCYPKGNGQDMLFVGKHGNNYSILKDKIRELGIIERNTFGKLQLLQEDELIEFIQSFFNGDGNLQPKHGHPWVSFYTGIHERIAYEMQFMLWRLGISSTISSRKREVHHNLNYEVKIAEAKSLRKLLLILDDMKYPNHFLVANTALKNIKDTSEHNTIWHGEWIPISSIKKIGKGTVCGWETFPSGEIISYGGLRTHNSGKSSLDEYIAMENFEAGHTVLDILSADNYESLFYFVNLNCKKYWEEKKKDPNALIPKYHCQCDKRYKVLLLVPDYVQIDQEWLDSKLANHKFFTKKEWKDAHPDSLEFPKISRCKKCEHEIKNQEKCSRCGSSERIITPPIHPDYKEWVKVKHIVIPNKGFKNRDKFVQQLTEALICGRDERRIITVNGVFNMKLSHKYKLLEQILRELKEVILRNFMPYDEYSVAKKRGLDKPIPVSEWTEEELNCHRVTILIREFGSIAPSGMKGINEETIVKKAMLDRIRLVRQSNITVIADFQRHADVIASIRDQKDFFIWKKTNQDMFPTDAYGWLLKEIHDKNQMIAMETNQGFADKVCPSVHDLKPSQMVVLYPNKLPNGRMWRIEKAKMPRHHHRQEDDNFEKITGLAFMKTWRFITRTEDGEMVETVKNEMMEDKKVQEATLGKLFDVVDKLQNPTDPSKKKMKYDEILEHCMPLNLIPSNWKVENLRKFMSNYRKRLVKPPTQN